MTANRQKTEKAPALPKNENVNVVVKVVAILDALSTQREATATQLAEQLSEPRSSVYRLLGSMQRMELVDVGSHRGTYRLGLKLLKLGNAVVNQLDLHRIAAPVMEDLRDAFGFTTFLFVRRGREAVCIERLDGLRVTAVTPGLGGSLALHLGAGPKSILAFSPRSEWTKYAAEGPVETFLARTPIDFPTLAAQLERCREIGYSVMDGDMEPEIAAVGAPVLDRRGVPIGSVSVSDLRRVIFEAGDALPNRVLAAGREISRLLGYDGEAPWTRLQTS
ncbi:MAG: IclR family transcriptional regulator [Thermoleophilia bacterium]|nr:IclR family transcriptional regulator [Thermoleophilia bacterium]